MSNENPVIEEGQAIDTNLFRGNDVIVGSPSLAAPEDRSQQITENIGAVTDALFPPVESEKKQSNSRVEIEYDQENPTSFLVTFPEKINGSGGQSVEVRRSFPFVTADIGKNFDKLPKETLLDLQQRMVKATDTLLDTGSLSYESRVRSMADSEQKPDYGTMLRSDPDGLAKLMVLEQMTMRGKELIAQYKPDFERYDRQEVLAAARGLEQRLAPEMNHAVAEEIKASHPEIYSKTTKEVLLNGLGVDNEEGYTPEEQKILEGARAKAGKEFLGQDTYDFLKAFKKSKQEKSLSFQIANSTEDGEVRAGIIRRLEGEILDGLDKFFPREQALTAVYVEAQFPARSGDRIMLSQRAETLDDGLKRRDVREALAIDSTKRVVKGSQKSIETSTFDIEAAKIRKEARTVSAMQELRKIGSDIPKLHQAAEAIKKAHPSVGQEFE